MATRKSGLTASFWIWMFIILSFSATAWPRVGRRGPKHNNIAFADLQDTHEIPDTPKAEVQGPVRERWPTYDEFHPVRDMGFDPQRVANIEKRFGRHPWIPAHLNHLYIRATVCINNQSYYTSSGSTHVFQIYCSYAGGSAPTLSSTTYCNTTTGSCAAFANNLQDCMDRCAGNYTGLGCRIAEYGSSNTNGRTCLLKGSGVMTYNAGVQAATYISEAPSAASAATYSCPSSVCSTFSSSSVAVSSSVATTTSTSSVV
jgi:hypothetical protein